MNLQLFLFSADCLLEKEKNSLQSSPSPSPSLVCAASLSCGTLVLSHVHACACSLLHTQTHTQNRIVYTPAHILTHTFCTNWFCLFCFGQRFWTVSLRANKFFFPNFYNCPVLFLLSSGVRFLLWILTCHGYCSSAAKGLTFWLLDLARKVQNPSYEELWPFSPVIWCCHCW